ncbi:unnamed protein product [Hydatigera taeniaeformis]|uniref:VPS9 domain-containing protein n=1 Tax=Hydatigena taeniaeformis TaxID=6205 RepID=A0A158RE07_HYDTA|nr:unnamed protein product [Hydatigera taeniaeformis]
MLFDAAFFTCALTEGLRSRSLEPAPFDRSTCHPIIAVSQPPLTPTIPRCISRQRQATFSAESDYETPEKIWLREQRLSAIRRTESARLTTPIHRGVSRSQSSGPRTHFDLDATPKASSSAFTEVTPKAQFGVRRRAPSMRVELRTPLCQRKRIQPMKEAETEAAILRKREGIYELEEPLMSGPSSLLQALKEVKFAEKEQLDRTPQAEPRRITLFDLIVEKERRHRVRSPPPVPPKPVRRLAATLATAAAARATTTMKPSQRSEQSIESSVPKTVNDLKPSTLFQLSTPPSLPLPPRCAVLKKASERSNNGSKTAVITTNKPSDQGNRKERTPPLISDNLFVRWDRLKSIPLTSPQGDTKGGRSISGGEGRISPGSSGVGTEAFDDDGFITASASAITPMSVCSSPSASSVNSSSSPSVDWPHPEKITARPLSHQCSPDSIDEPHLFPKLKELNGNADEARTITGHSPVRVSLVAAPKKSLPTSDNLPPETASDTNTITTSSSRASTIFSYPWDLPPPQAQQPSSSSSPPPPVPLKWATLQRHLLEMNHSPPHALATPQQNGCDSKDIPERRSSVVSLESNEGPKSETMKNVEEEKTYATIGDESGAYERVLERRPSLEVPSPKLQQISATGSIEESQKDSMPHYVYAEVRPSSDVSTSSSTRIRSPPVPAHPSKTNAMPISPEIHLYEVIRSSIAPPEAGQGSFESHSSTSISSNSTERQNPTNRSSESASVASELGKHLEHLVYGLMKDRNSPFYKHMSTFIECIIQQLGQTPQKTLQNICQFINGVSNFLQKVHAAELRQAVEAEERDLRGLQYLDVAQELENLMQLTVLRPLHRRLIEDLQRHGCGTVPPQTAEEFTDLVKQEYRKLPNLSQEDRQRLEKTLFQPVRRIFYQMQDAFQPSDKLDCLIRIFNTINLQVQVPANSISGQGRDAKKFVIYATILALVDLLRPSRTLDAKGDSDTSTGISRIEVQRLYLEALIAPSRLASSAEGCKCLTDLICLLRYVENFKCYTSPTETIRLIARKSQQATEIEESLCHPNLNTIRRSYTDNIQEALDRSNDYPLTFSFASPPWQERRVRKIGCSQGAEKTPIPSTPSASSSILVLAANEAERLLVPYEIPLRQSLTVRELCNMLALKLEIFDSKDYTLFYHSVSGGEFDNAGFSDFLMSDTLHLERFIIQCPDASVQSVDEEMGITFSSSSSIDVLTNSQPTTPKVSPFRRFFRRQKRLINSNSLKSESPLPQCQHHQKSKGVMKRQPSIDWSTMGGRDANFVLIYRRRSSEAVLYANDLFECLPGLGKLI